MNELSDLISTVPRHVCCAHKKDLHTKDFMRLTGVFSVASHELQTVLRG